MPNSIRYIKKNNKINPYFFSNQGFDESFKLPRSLKSKHNSIGDLKFSMNLTMKDRVSKKKNMKKIYMEKRNRYKYQDKLSKVTEIAN